MKYFIHIATLFLAFIFIYALSFKSIVTANYFVNQSEIIELFCENKEQPKLQCNGKCHLAKELIKTENKSSKLPFTPNNTEYNLELIFDFIEADKLKFALSPIKNNWINSSTPLISRGYTPPTPPPQA